MTVLCVNSTVVYADITAADAAESGIDYGVPTRFEQTGTSSSAVVFSNADYPSSFIYIATSGEETTGVITVGAQCTGLITTSVANGVIESLRTGRINSATATGHHNQSIVGNGGGSLDVFGFSNTLAGTDDNCIAHNCSEGWRAGASNDSHITTNCTAVDTSGFGMLRPRAVDSVSLETGSSAYLQVGASSSNYWADDGTGSNAITEVTKTDIFEDYAGGDYRIKAASSPGVAGAGAFINSGGSGVTVTADSQDYNVTFYDASIDLTGEVLVNAETQSYQVQFFDGQVSLVSGIEVQAQAQSYDVIFYDALVQLSGTININADSHTYSVTFYDGTVVIADVWTDKPKAVTSWANQSSVATIWTDK